MIYIVIMKVKLKKLLFWSEEVEKVVKIKFDGK